MCTVCVRQEADKEERADGGAGQKAACDAGGGGDSREVYLCALVGMRGGRLVCVYGMCLGMVSMNGDSKGRGVCVHVGVCMWCESRQPGRTLVFVRGGTVVSGGGSMRRLYVREGWCRCEGGLRRQCAYLGKSLKMKHTAIMTLSVACELRWAVYNFILGEGDLVGGHDNFIK